VRKDNAPIELILLDGSRLNGQVRGFDNFTVILQTGGDQHLIYKHAIAQVINQRGTYRPPEREFHGARPNDAPRAPKPRAPQPAEPKADKSKFNTIDLSDVKID
jgi:host factor-I protein